MLSRTRGRRFGNQRGHDGNQTLIQLNCGENVTTIIFRSVHPSACYPRVLGLSVMAYASCERCKYQCRLASHLLGKHIRCPKCKSVVEVVASLTSTVQVSLVTTSSDASASNEDSGLFLGNMMKRRGPLSMSQLQLLARCDLIDVHDMVSDESGTRRSTVKEFLAGGGWPAPRKAAKRTKPAAAPALPPVEKPRRSSSSQYQYTVDFSTEAAPKEEAVTYDEFGRAMMPDEFKALIERAVQMEKHACTVEFDQPESEIEIYVPGPCARLVRSLHFAKAYRAVAFVFIINAIVCCFFSTSTMGMFVKRLLKLSASVFIPFEQTGELIEGEPLLQCGLALGLVCGQFVLPIWWLVRQDCVIWHCLGATFLGLVLGMAMKPEWLWFGFEGIRAALVLSGLAVAVIAWGLAGSEHAEAISARIRIAAAVTAVLSLAVLAIDMESIFVADLSELSPKIKGSGIDVIGFAVCFLGVMISIPLAICSIIYEESPEVIRTFMIGKVFTIIFLAGVGAISSLCLIYPQSANFLNVPMAVLPLACGSVLATITPPVLWLLDPEYSLARSGA